MEFGITGTQIGLTDLQSAKVHNVLERICARIKPRVEKGESLILHEGCCVGADDQITTMFLAMASYAFVTEHPPANTSKMVPHINGNTRLDPHPYLVRNRHIVDSSEFILACPKQMTENQRGGTWYTIRYARAQNVPIVIVWPDGSATHEGDFEFINQTENVATINKMAGNVDDPMYAPISFKEDEE